MKLLKVALVALEAAWSTHCPRLAQAEELIPQSPYGRFRVETMHRERQ